MGLRLSDEYIEAHTLTGHVCADCGDTISYGEECWLLQVVQPQRVDGKILQHVVIDEDDPDGDFLYEPYFFCHACWEANYEGLREECADTPPVADPHGLGLFECVCCGSDIREWEYTGSFSIGEFHLSKRAPNNVRGPHFVHASNAEMMCLNCLVVLNEGFIEMWSDLSHTGECSDCVAVRCWRYGANACSCHCHTDPTQGET